MGTTYYGIREDRKRQYKRNYGLQILNLKRKIESLCKQQEEKKNERN